jgi:hypothetical protein
MKESLGGHWNRCENKFKNDLKDAECGQDSSDRDV